MGIFSPDENGWVIGKSVRDSINEVFDKYKNSDIPDGTKAMLENIRKEILSKYDKW